MPDVVVGPGSIDKDKHGSLFYTIFLKGNGILPWTVPWTDDACEFPLVMEQTWVHKCITSVIFQNLY